LLTRALFAAVSAGRVSVAERLIVKGADSLARAPDATQGTLLMIAARSRNPAMLRAMLRYPHDVDAVDSEGQTALDAVLQANTGEFERTRAVRLLIAAGADVNHVDHSGMTPIFYACGRSLQIFGMLKRAGAKVNLHALNGDTPLMACSAQQSTNQGQSTQTPIPSLN
jgi:ankyrin repeat protein